MKKIDRFETETFDMGAGFYMDIVHDKTEKQYEAWCYSDNYAKKESMFRWAEGNDEFKEAAFTEFDEYAWEYISNLEKCDRFDYLHMIRENELNHRELIDTELRF